MRKVRTAVLMGFDEKEPKKWQRYRHDRLIKIKM
jgi:hypothetical protein